jgi:uncharacterized iron-regulated membrane protein
MKSFKTTIWLSISLLLLSGILHSLSFLGEPVPANESEKQLLDLMHHYQMDMGAGFSRSFNDIFISLSACFTLICLFGGVLLWYLNRQILPVLIWKGVLNIYLLFFGVLFALMLIFTFLPPIICTGAVWFALMATRWSAGKLEP